MKQTNAPHRVLVTGAYGLIGNLAFAALLREPDRFEPYGMVRRLHASARIADEELVRIPDDRLRLADVRDADAVRRAMEGMNTVVHLAGDPDGMTGWQRVLESNIAGLYNVFESAREAGVRRLIYASTNQVVFGYRDHEPYRTHFGGSAEESLSVPIPPIRHDQPVRRLLRSLRQHAELRRHRAHEGGSRLSAAGPWRRLSLAQTLIRSTITIERRKEREDEQERRARMER